MSVTLRARVAKLAFALAGVTLLVSPTALAKKRAPDDVVPPRVITKSQRPPVFPPAAKAARFQGEVTVRVTVLPTGVPTNLLVIHSSHTRVGFEEAAVAAIEKWRFIPATHRGVPVEYQTQYRLTFGRHGAGVSGGGEAMAVKNRNDSANPPATPPSKPPTNTGAGTRTSPRRR